MALCYLRAEVSDLQSDGRLFVAHFLLKGFASFPGFLRSSSLHDPEENDAVGTGIEGEAGSLGV